MFWDVMQCGLVKVYCLLTLPVNLSQTTRGHIPDGTCLFTAVRTNQYFVYFLLFFNVDIFPKTQGWNNTLLARPCRRLQLFI